MAQFIAEHYTQSLRIEHIAKAVKLNPGYAMTAFRRIFGVTMTQYINQHRISHAQRLLATTDAKILNIALDCGFGSLSRFNDVFKRICGQSPKHYRNSLR